MKLTMGTRGSALALAQARQVARALEAAHPDLTVEERIIRTTGDAQQGAPLPQIGGKGVFTLEIERALLDGTIHFAVHSLKDLPPEMPDGLTLAAIPPREDASDCCIVRSVEKATGIRLEEQPLPQPLPQGEGSSGPLTSIGFLFQGAHVGTSSLRRRAQLLHLRPDLRVADVRGNVDTRLRKLDAGEFDAIVLATAGLNRLSLDRDEPLVAPARAFRLSERDFIPAPGQGALAIQSRDNDGDTLSLLSALDHFETRAQVEAERALLRALNAGCTTPLGARAYSAGGLIIMSAHVLSPDGVRMVEAEAYGALEDAEFVGEECAALLREAGADDLLN